MQQLLITHSTTYRYSGVVTFGRHRLVVRPREGHDVRVESLRLDINVGHEVVWTRDVFGNSVALVDFFGEAAELVIRNEVVLVRHGVGLGRSAEGKERAGFPVVYDPLESAVAAAYRATTYGEDADSVLEFLRREGFLVEGGLDAEAVLDRLNGVLFERVKYNRRPEKGTQSPGETLEKLSGSCRDIATLLMECARGLGMAARFASGYLDCAASAAGRASTHAWVEVYLPHVGWIGFDPTIGERCSGKHIACGLSNHPRGVMPVSGAWNPVGGAVYLGMEVGVQIERV